MAASANRIIAARTELHPFASETLSNRQFLTGAADGRKVVIAGALRLAQGAPQGMGRLPVVVLLHGSGGIGGNVDHWATRLTGWGISSFTIDSFTGRGLTQTSTDQALLGRLNMILDLYRALAVLAAHPSVDRERIAVMGFSRGGQATLYASLDRFHRLHNRSGIAPAAYIPFYPDCATFYIGDTEVSDRPIRIFHGTSDDFNPIAPCRAYVARLQEAGSDVRLFELADAWHGYDNPLLAPVPAVVANAQTVRGCRIVEGPEGELINAGSGAAFSYDDPCVERNPHVAHNAAALRATERELRRLLRGIFALG